MLSVGSYQVPIQTSHRKKQLALLGPAQKCEMPNDWDCSWQEFWNKTNFEFGGIISLKWDGRVFGLVSYSLYPDKKKPQGIFISHLEALPSSRGDSAQRILKPIGRWLIWYVATVALQKCLVDGSTPYIILLTSGTEAVDYYRDKIGMHYIGPESLGPDEDGYGFGFSSAASAKFCKEQEARYGSPSQIQVTETT